MAVAKVRVACTMSGAMQLGSTPEKTIWVLPAPRARFTRYYPSETVFHASPPVGLAR
jgi:hypothetical protein